MHYEIVVYENASMYTSTLIPVEGFVNAFITTCVKYISPTYIHYTETEFNYGKMFVSFSENTESDKPMMVMLIGPTIDQTLYDEIIGELKKAYMPLIHIHRTG